jgi:branched-subunit amino acid aminotransferase/4-amino-4-deoxychorismate lyase
LQVLVAGSPREVAHAKHCEWVQQRQPLEQLRQQAGADEVLLPDSSGALLEGLVSNFFVIANEAELGLLQDQDAAAAAAAAGSGDGEGAGGTDPPSSSSSCKSTAEFVLLTAGVKDAALPGVCQARVLQACEQLGLKVLQHPARMEQRHAWREAFLTNW